MIFRERLEVNFVPVAFKDIKKGDIFRVLENGDIKIMTASGDTYSDGNNYIIPADKLYGNPTIILQKFEKDLL